MVTVKKVHTKRGKGIAGIGPLSRGPTAVKVGFVKGEADADVIQRAIWQEFGTKGSGKPFVKKAKGGKMIGGFGGPIPERPFMRNAMRENASKYRNMLRQGAAKIIRAVAEGANAGTTIRLALRQLGVTAQGDVQASIISLTSPPNSPLTIALKGSSNPLVDTGEMHNKVAWKIDE